MNTWRHIGVVFPTEIAHKSMRIFKWSKRRAKKTSETVNLFPFLSFWMKIITFPSFTNALLKLDCRLVKLHWFQLKHIVSLSVLVPRLASHTVSSSYYMHVLIFLGGKMFIPFKKLLIFGYHFGHVEGRTSGANSSGKVFTSGKWSDHEK